MWRWVTPIFQLLFPTCFTRFISARSRVIFPRQRPLIGCKLINGHQFHRKKHPNQIGYQWIRFLSLCLLYLRKGTKHSEPIVWSSLEALQCHIDPDRGEHFWKRYVSQISKTTLKRELILMKNFLNIYILLY